MAPQISNRDEVTPRIAYSVTQDEATEALTGQQQFRRDTAVLFCFADTQDQVDDLAEAIKDRMAVIQWQTVAGVSIADSFFRSESESNFLPDANERPIFEKVLTFEVANYG